MKKADIKLDEIYYLKRTYGGTVPCRFIDLKQLVQYTKGNGWGRTQPEIPYSRALDTYRRPYAGDQWDVGYAVVVIREDTPENRKAAEEITMEDLLLAKGGTPDNKALGFDLVLSFAKVIGPYDEVMADLKRAAEADRADRLAQVQRAEELEARFDAVNARLESVGIKVTRQVERMTYTVAGGFAGFTALEKIADMADFVEAVRQSVTTYDGSRPIVVEISNLLEELDGKLNPQKSE